MIADRWVMTAAHCVAQAGRLPIPPEAYSVWIGGVDFDKRAQGVQIGVVDIIVHQQFEPLISSDIALLELAEPAPAQIPRAQLATGAIDSLLTGTLKEATVSGWGIVDLEMPEGQSRLQEVKVPVMDNELCSEFIDLPGGISDQQICFGPTEGEQRGSCVGDSGGPAWVRTDDADYIVGITSFGRNGCTDINEPGVYTRVSEFRSWVEQTIARNDRTVGPDVYSNAGHTGTWTTDHPGEGLFLQVIDRGEQTHQKEVFAAWMTSDLGTPEFETEEFGSSQNRWFTLQGPLDDETAELDIYVTHGATFSGDEAPTTSVVGSATLTFLGCGEGRLSFEIESPQGPVAGELPLHRLIPEDFLMTACNTLRHFQ